MIKNNANKLIGKFEFSLHDVIGRGTYGIVYKGKNTVNNQ